MKSYQIHIYSSELEPVSSYRWISVTLLQIELIAFQRVSEKTVIDRDFFKLYGLMSRAWSLFLFISNQFSPLLL